MEYLLQGLDMFTASIFIRNLPHIKVPPILFDYNLCGISLPVYALLLQRINGNGVKRLLRSVFGLQQNLNAVLKSRDAVRHAFTFPALTRWCCFFS